MQKANGTPYLLKKCAPPRYATSNSPQNLTSATGIFQVFKCPTWLQHRPRRVYVQIYVVLTLTQAF